MFEFRIPRTSLNLSSVFSLHSDYWTADFPLRNNQEDQSSKLKSTKNIYTNLYIQ